MSGGYDDELSRPLEGALEASTSEGPTSPAVGRDEWVARHGDNRTRRGGLLGTVEARLRVVPWWAWLATFVALFCLLPVASDSGYVRRVAFDIAIYMLLALGLNVVVGWGGLLDLGYIAFFGIGAYAYAFLSSDHYGIHLPSFVSIPLVVVIGATTGFLVGLPSRRLTGDYLAIVTLFFLLLFLTVTTNGDDLFGHNVTGGANGLLNADPLSLFGHELPPTLEGGLFNPAYMYVVLAVFVVVYVALRFVNLSRTGRAWRSLREDPLAAEVMGMPVNSLKLMSFAFGAAIAALSGTFVTMLSASVFPLSFSFPLLIIIYTMVILGGSGSQPGVVLGAVLIGTLLELLRDPGDSRVLFYAAIVLGVLGAFRFSVKLAVVVAGTFVFGFVAHSIAGASDNAWVNGSGGEGGGVADFAANWVIVPVHVAAWVAPVSYVSLVALALVLTLLHGWARIALLIPVLYLAAFVWENVMIAQPEPTRYIILGVILIALMIFRPTGLLGEKRVEII
ncbi:MAG: branched-chain amino acid ABC transporter permease [Thermoleophilia bacterium]|nr:branched-chain amino acid ABC transporter permease [Thermoleophilia bacterium]